jgi:hypothetical protein
MGLTLCDKDSTTRGRWLFEKGNKMTQAEMLDSQVYALVNNREDYSPIALQTIERLSNLIDSNVEFTRGEGFWCVEFSDGSNVIYDDEEVEA